MLSFSFSSSLSHVLTLNLVVRCQISCKFSHRPFLATVTCTFTLLPTAFITFFSNHIDVVMARKRWAQKAKASWIFFVTTLKYVLVVPGGNNASYTLWLERQIWFPYASPPGVSWTPNAKTSWVRVWLPHSLVFEELENLERRAWTVEAKSFCFLQKPRGVWFPRTVDYEERRPDCPKTKVD